MPVNNMAMDISYNYNNKDYSASTSSLSDTYSDTRTWQYDGNKWAFAEPNTVTVPEFSSMTSTVLVISIISIIVLSTKIKNMGL